MGTIAEKLSKLSKTKAAIRDAIIEKGQTVEESELFSAYPDKIRAIPSGGASQEEIEAYLAGACIDFAATEGENTLHLRQQENGFDCVISWGDGEETTVPADGGNVVHSYAQAGTYRIYITGKSFAGFYVNRQEGAEKYVALHSMGRWEKDTMVSAERAFSFCTGLTTLPGDLFRYNLGITNFNGAFTGCSGLTALPGDLFRYNGEAELFGSTFAGCTGLATLPGDLFRYNKKAVNFSSAFMDDSALTELPQRLFAENVAAKAFQMCFSGCANLTALPPDLFRYNVAAVLFSNCFWKCVKLRLREDIFGTEYETRFAGQTPNFTRCFQRDSYEGEQGKAPELWRFTLSSSAAYKRACFGGAGNSMTSLSNYGDIPAEWK